MLHKPEVLYRKFRNFFSRSKWLIRLSKLAYVPEKEAQRGLIMIQIDALSRRQLEAALQAGRMPFLKNLLKTQHYTLQTHYSGMPCCTPAVQAELFYGVPCAVPSFCFFDADQQRTFVMFNPDDAKTIESRLEKNGTGLFQDGSSYSNIYTGGAAEPHFCISDLQFRNVFGRWRTLSFTVAVLLHVFSLLRAGALLVIETVMAVMDCFRGLVKGQDLMKELKFVPSRVAICILLREVIVIGVKMDITRGLPIIQANLMGYHEQSHRRGASSRFAHWTLKGIDNAIKRMWQNAQRADKEYDFWVYSDHGQVDTVPYESVFGQSLQETVKGLLDGEKETVRRAAAYNRPGFINRLGWRLQKMLRGQDTPSGHDNQEVVVTSLGPMAQVYLNTAAALRKKELAEKLINTGKIPMVLIPHRQGETRCVQVVTPAATYELPEQADTFFFENQFIPSAVVEDFIKACHHPCAGDLIVSGYQGPNAPYYAFVKENGSHGGVCEFEYSGFLIAPENGPVHAGADVIRPTDIRHGALRVLRRPIPNDERPSEKPQAPSGKGFRIMTYNVHSCIGMDGRLSPLRIAKTIEQFNPDIVALQELDVGRHRSDHADQAQVIADILKMDHFFSPAIALEEEQYGDAILSRFPMHLIKSDILPGHVGFPFREPRGALWVQIDIDGRMIQVLTTHLGLTSDERRQQIHTLLSDQWLKQKPFNGPVVFCGDFNFSPRSGLYRQCRREFSAAGPSSAPLGTYCGRYPFIRLDHIFYRQGLTLHTCKTGDTDLARIASDHRPLIADFEFTST